MAEANNAVAKNNNSKKC